MSPLLTVTTGAGELAKAADAWDATRADQSIQFAPLKAPPAPEEPAWLKALFDWLGELFRPVGRALGESWPVLKWVLLAIAIIAIGYLIWRLVAPMLGWTPEKREEEDEETWAPDHSVAIALLEDADRLASEGRFDAATHLLLQRSVGHIADVRPDLVDPSTTARELAGLAALPDGARNAFSTIASRVERSLFALSPLDQNDWSAARAAYSEFALARIGR
ncbi:hypothetical protein [Tsuneonella mangrovi]|uniref:hypothetical protein n=1 Tax=Tsuneonella mangrovi TaxID=1982042 RepID=UPI001F0B3776|nr:hypothetical protein [Tsuneonella mangrovi]